MLRPMTQARTPDDIRDMADEVARLMGDRLGGARRGEFPSLGDMIRRRGAALPGRLRAQAKVLAEADQWRAQPRVARQMDLRPAARAHAALVKHLRPLGGVSRWQGRAVNLAASLALGLLVLAALVIWLMVRRGHL